MYDYISLVFSFSQGINHSCCHEKHTYALESVILSAGALSLAGVILGQLLGLCHCLTMEQPWNNEFLEPFLTKKNDEDFLSVETAFG